MVVQPRQAVMRWQVARPARECGDRRPEVGRSAVRAIDGIAAFHGTRRNGIGQSIQHAGLSPVCNWATTRPMAISAVIFDLGGVVLDSPLDVFVAYERELGIPAHTVNRNIVAAGQAGAWSRLERGELTMPEFYEAFDAEMAAAGVHVSGAAIMERLASNTAIRPAAVAAIRKLRATGHKVGALTNNWANEDQGSKMEILQI